jgi:hypothetical protein
MNIVGLGRKKLHETGKIFHKKDIHNLHSSPNIIRVIKSKAIKWAGGVSRAVRREMLTKFSGETRKERDYVVVIFIDGRMIL